MTEPDDRDLLAGEYALGCLEGEELAKAERLLRQDPVFGTIVKRWEHRFMPLLKGLTPHAPSDMLWRRIETSLGPARSFGAQSPSPATRLWKTATAVAFALAAALAITMIIRPPPSPNLAILAPLDAKGPFFVAQASSGRLQVSALGLATAPEGKDFELWSLPPSATKPISLGVLTGQGRVIDAQLASGTQLLVSLEPKGGSPTGQPTGPVMFAGKLTMLQLSPG